MLPVALVPVVALEPVFELVLPIVPAASREVLLAPFVPVILLVDLPVEWVPEAVGGVLDDVLLPVVCA